MVSCICWIIFCIAYLCYSLLRNNVVASTTLTNLSAMPVSGSPQNTPPNCRSGAIVTCVLSARFQSTEVWIPWTQKLSLTPKCCCPHPNTAHETKVTWEPWAPSVRLVGLLPSHLRVISAVRWHYCWNNKHNRAACKEGSILSHWKYLGASDNPIFYFFFRGEPSSATFKEINGVKV